MIIINLALMVACLFLIIETNVRQKELIQYATNLTVKYPWLPKQAKELASLAPTLVVQAVNGLSVPLIKKIVDLEKWDFQYQ